MNKALLSAALILSFASAAVAQDSGHFDASFSWGAVFSKHSSTPLSGVALNPTDSTLLLGTFHVRFHRLHGLEFNFGRTHDSQIYVLGADNFRVRASITELSGAYVINPFQFHKFEPFALAGVGALRFTPGNTYIDGFQSAFGANQQTAMAFLYGGGMDYTFWRGLALRLQYRGLFYRNPTFKLPQFFTGTRGHMAEPTVGIVLKF